MTDNTQPSGDVGELLDEHEAWVSQCFGENYPPCAERVRYQALRQAVAAIERERDEAVANYERVKWYPESPEARADAKEAMLIQRTGELNDALKERDDLLVIVRDLEKALQVTLNWMSSGELVEKEPSHYMPLLHEEYSILAVRARALPGRLEILAQNGWGVVKPGTIYFVIDIQAYHDCTFENHAQYCKGEGDTPRAAIDAAMKAMK